MRKNEGVAFSKWIANLKETIPFKFLRTCYDKNMKLDEAVVEYEKRY